MLYHGKDRRVHTCYITRNREYHTRSGVCVAVRDRCSSAWMSGHKAVGLTLADMHSGSIIQGFPLDFASMATRVRTSPVVDILRPGRNVVETYLLVSCLQSF